MKFKKIVITLLLSASFGFSGIGSSGAQFMQIGAGTRAVGMGMAYVAYADGIDAIFYNPAGLTSISDSRKFSFNHVNYFADMSYDNIAFTMPFLGGVVGVSGIGLFSGDIDVTTVEEPEGTGETYSVDEYAVGVSYGVQFTQKFSMGISLKMVSQSLAELSASGWAMDVGATYNTGLLNNLRIGFAMLNFGPDLRYEGDDLLFRTRVHSEETAQDEDARAEYLTEFYQLPLRLQLGVAIDVINYDNQKLVLAVDGINPNDQNETFGVGMEYTFRGMLALRAGYSDINGKGLSAGASTMVGSKENNFVLNYGFENHEFLGDLHRFGLDLSF